MEAVSLVGYGILPSKENAVAQKQGAIWGAVFGFVAGTGPLGGVAASLVGGYMSTPQLMEAADKLRDNLHDKCAWIQFGAAMAGLTGSAVGAIGSYNYGGSTGRWIGWEPIGIGGAPAPQSSGPRLSSILSDSSSIAIAFQPLPVKPS